MVRLRTERLIIRDWREADLAPWAELNADPAVREYLGPVLTPEQSTASVRRFQADLDQVGFGFWALEVAATGRFIGFVGLDVVEDGLPFGGVEIGWRLARSVWGHGYATESATEVLQYGFAEVGLTEILAITAEANARSRAVMTRLGLVHEPAWDFDEESNPASRQVVYRIGS
jgi:RimJ/RimL family protein N-acetyltransferase